MSAPWVVFVESNTSGTGRLFARAAARQGARPVLLTADPSLYKFIAEERLDVRRVETRDEAALVEACRLLEREAALAGVLSSSEYFVAAAAALARRLGLPGPDPAAVRACRDKSVQRRRLRDAGVAVPGFRTAASAEEAVRGARELGLPVVVKPVSGTGSIGVKLCAGAEAVAEHARALLGQRTNERGQPVPPRVLVEELAVGREYSVETFGREVVGVTEKHLGGVPYFVEVGHDYPAQLPARVREGVCREALRALDALGLGWGPAHLELRLTGRGPRIIEVNPRLAGGYIPELVRLAFGVDLIEETVRLATGQRPRVERRRDRHASIRFVLAPSGGVGGRTRETLGRAAAVPGVVELEFYTGPGEVRERRGDFRDRVGHVIAAADTAVAARAAAERAHGLIG